MRGGDSSGLRAYNERMIVNEIRRSGPMSKAEIARATGLSGQAASVIVNSLLADKVLTKLEKVRGQVGQPYTPIALNPDGGYTLGIKIGRNSVEVVMMNLVGDVISNRFTRHNAPFPEPTLDTAIRFARELQAEMSTDQRSVLVGAGIAIPGELHEWAQELGLEADALSGWKDLDLTAIFEEALSPLPVMLYNDTTAACAAEVLVGKGIQADSAIYFYLGTFIGGGIVIGGRLYRGAQFNAGALGSMPLGGLTDDGRPKQLIHAASVIDLNHALVRAGMHPNETVSEDPTPAAEELFVAWMAQAVPAVAKAVVTSLSIIDFETVVIDGILNPRWRTMFCDRLREEMTIYSMSGLSPAAVVEGSIGAKARVLGAALLPLNARFSPDTDLLVKSGLKRGDPK